VVSVIVIDSNVWIFAEVKDAAEHGPAAERVQQLLGRETIGLNAIIFSEVFYKLARLVDVETAKDRVRTVTGHPSVEWLPIERGTGEKAMELCELAKLRTNDALIAQQAVELRPALLIDNVRDFRKVKGLKVIPRAHATHVQRTQCDRRWHIAAPSTSCTAFAGKCSTPRDFVRTVHHRGTTCARYEGQLVAIEERVRRGECAFTFFEGDFAKRRALVAYRKRER